jgi:hypothetical protein
LQQLEGGPVSVTQRHEFGIENAVGYLCRKEWISTQPSDAAQRSALRLLMPM